MMRPAGLRDPVEWGELSQGQVGAPVGEQGTVRQGPGGPLECSSAPSRRTAAINFVEAPRAQPGQWGNPRWLRSREHSSHDWMEQTLHLPL
jgi:hypothetical protein